MTPRGAGALVVGLVLIAVGWPTAWPELTALGAATLTLVILAALMAGPRPVATVELDGGSLRVVRGEAAMVPITVRPQGRHRWMRVVEGDPKHPTRSLGLPAKTRSDGVVIPLPVDTSRRGEYLIGPYAVVHGDPWSMTRRVIAQVTGGTLTVVPRTYPVPAAILRSVTVEDTMLSARRAGEQHFHALRDYVLGDEPRTVHWRSSARVGHLVVRQQVAAATTGITVVLDCDTTAYGSDEQFGSGWVADRFEAAVEVAASLVVADIGRGEQVHLMRTTRGSATITVPAGMTNSCLDHLAVVQPVAPVESDPAALPQRVRRSRSSRAILVTGSPQPATVDALRRIGRSGTSVVMIRVGSQHLREIPGVSVFDVADPTALATWQL